jgi:hypothetical protein
MDVVKDHPFVFAAALLLGAAVVGTFFFLADKLSGDEEAPIRVRSGSVDFFLLTQRPQHWQQVGGSQNWRVAGAERFKEEFEVTVAPRPGASCSPSLTATGSNVVLTYVETANPQNVKTLTLDAAGRNTMVRPDSSITLTSADGKTLSYTTAEPGYIRQITVGSGGSSGVLCSFSAPGQLDHMLILNVPQ